MQEIPIMSYLPDSYKIRSGPGVSVIKIWNLFGPILRSGGACNLLFPVYPGLGPYELFLCMLWLRLSIMIFSLSCNDSIYNLQFSIHKGGNALGCRIGVRSQRH
jgi:hypothetical protein